MAVSARAHELFQARNAYDGTKATNLFRSSADKYDPVSRRILGLKVAGGVRIDVFVRCRPLSDLEELINEPVVVKLAPLKKTVQLKTTTSTKAKGDVFSYDAVFGPSSSQTEVYSSVAAPVVDEALKGMNCCILAYGQTGTGKTYTMLGDMTSAGLEDEGHAGLVPRAVQAIFAKKVVTDDETRCEYAQSNVTVSFMEIYNEQIEDLFNPAAREVVDDWGAAAGGTGSGSPRSRAGDLKLVDDKLRGTVCQGLTEVTVKDPSEVMALLEEANSRCHIAATKLNKQSNRAHRIFTITTTYIDTARVSNQKVGKLTLVDLAGSECIGRSGVVDDVAKEAGTINKSLLTLGRVIQALVHNEKHVPYRDSKLTRLLAEALGGVCKTSIIATVSPAARSADETLSTLRYAQSAMDAVNIEQLPKARRLELQAKQLAAAYEQLAADSEKHINALQRNLAVAVDERKQAIRQLDLCQVQLTTALKEKAAVESDNVHLKIKVHQLEEEGRTLREANRLTQLDLREIVVDRDLVRQVKDSTEKELEWLRVQHDALLANQQDTLEGLRTSQAAALEDTVDATNFTKARVDEDFAKIVSDLARIQENVVSLSDTTADEHMESHARSTAFVAEVTQLLNRLDKYVKESVTSFAASMEEQRTAMAEQLKRELAASEVQEAELLGRIGELVKAHSTKNSQRLETVASALKLSTTRSEHTLQELGSRTSEQLTTIGQRGSRYYQNSETFAADTQSKSAERVARLKHAVATVSTKSEGVRQGITDQITAMKDMISLKSNDVTHGIATGVNALEDAQAASFQKPQPQRRTLQYIASTRPEDVPPSVSGALPKLDAARTTAPSTPTPSIAELLKDRGEVIPVSEFNTPKKVVEAMLHAASPRGIMSGTRQVGFAEVMRGRTSSTSSIGDVNPSEQESFEHKQRRSASTSDLDGATLELEEKKEAFDPKRTSQLVEALLDTYSPSRARRNVASASPPPSLHHAHGTPNIGGMPVEERAMSIARTLQSSSPLTRGGFVAPPASPAGVASQQQQPKPKSYTTAPAGTKKSPRSASAVRGSTTSASRTGTPAGPFGGRSVSRIKERGEQ